MHSLQCLVMGVTLYLVPGIWSENPGEPHITVTTCCPPGYALLLNKSCVHFDTGPFMPPIYIDEVLETDREVAVNADWSPACGSTHLLKRENLDSEMQLHFLEDEVLLFWLSPDTMSWLMVDTFCVAASSDRDISTGKLHYVVEFCYKDPIIQWREDEIACQSAKCVRKCCHEGEILNGTCQLPHEDIVWAPVFHSIENHTIVVQEPPDMLIVYGVPECPVSLIYDDFVLLESGKIEVPDLDQEVLPNQYCLDAFANENGGAVEKLVLCNTENDTCWWRNFIVDTLFMSISCIFLAITWLIYICIPELRTNTQGRCMISFITALFIAFVTILVLRNHRENFSSFQCSFTAILSNMSILATFFWLNVLSYHIWDCLRTGKKRDEKRVFLAYSIYGWGCPLLVAVVGIIFDATKADVLRPDFLPPHCWFKDRATKWVYQYGFMLALLLINSAFFVSSAFMMSRRLRQAEDMNHHSYGLWLYLKLVILMGITWLIEMITWLLEENSCKTWVAVLDGITALHGLYLFLVTVCFNNNLRIFRHCGRTKYEVDGNTLSSSRDNSVELMDDQKK